MSVRRCSAITTLLALTVVLTSSAEAAKAPTPARQLVTLRTQTAALPTSVQRTRMLRAVATARTTFVLRPCVAVSALRTYSALGSRLPKSQLKRTVRLQTRALALMRQALRSKRARRCGGGVPISTARGPATVLGASTAQELSFTATLPEVVMTNVVRGGRVWTQLGSAGLATPQRPGEPAIPTASFTIAVPAGATITVTSTTLAGPTYRGIDVLPAQPETLDQLAPPDFRLPPYVTTGFVGAGPAYRRAFPPKPVTVTDVGHARDLRIATVRVPLADYNGRTKTLAVHRGVQVHIAFDGGTGFAPSGGAWDRFGASIATETLNRNAIPATRTRPFRCGNEFLIITSATTRSAADELAAARNAAGISTAVLETGTPSLPNDAIAIRDAIRGALTSLLCVRPSYVLLLGNEELVPAFEIDGATSDLPYATVDDADTLPDVATGRIPGRDLAEVQAAVRKSIAYANGDGATGRTALIAAQFQDDNGDGQEDRTFIQMAETARAGLVAGGHIVTRVYADAPATTPARFNDGSALPADLIDAAQWNGSTSDISTAWNANPFLVLHRDHGWSQGWGTPSFTSAQVDALSNVIPAVVLSINCSSGAYDRDDASFATRALVRPTGGAVAVFGDTEDSPSWHNSQQALGFLDALVPEVLPDTGPDRPLRLGDALVSGKLRLNSVAPAPGDGNTVFEHRIWHLLGDPTLYLRRASFRIPFDRSLVAVKFQHGPIINPGDPPPNYSVTVAGLAALEGQPVSLLRSGAVVGQGIVSNGSVVVAATFGDAFPAPGELSVVAAPQDGAQPVTVPVSSTKSATTLTQTCPTTSLYGSPSLTVTGTLTGAPTGQTVTVTFTQLARTGPVSRTATALTDGSGAYTATLTLQKDDLSDWSVRSDYPGSTGTEAATSSSCTITTTFPTIP